MRLYSTPESAKAGEVTLLAIVETALATSVTILIALTFDTLRYAVIGACVAPLLLMRTNGSAYLVWQWARMLDQYLQGLMRTNGAAKRKALFVFAHPIILSLFRPISVLLAVVQTPLAVLRAIPGNWVRVAFATDLRHPPELLPDAETRSDAFPYVRFAVLAANLRRIIKAWREPRPRGARPAMVALFLLWLGAFLGAVLYRWSVKSTALIYLPFIYVARMSFTPGDVAERLHDAAYSAREWLKRWYALTVVVPMTAIAVMVFLKIQPLLGWLGATVREDVLDIYITEVEIKLWHLAAFANATMTIALWIFADKAVRRERFGRAWPEPVVDLVLTGTRLVQGFIGLYTTAVALYFLTKVTWPDSVVFRWWP